MVDQDENLTQLSFGGKLNKLGRNFYYYITKGDPNYFPEKGKPLYLLGQEHHYENFKKSKLDESLNRVIWYSYRNQLPFLLTSKNSMNYYTDSGWGCTIRVAYMLFSTAFINHLKEESVSVPELKKKIILLFNDDNDAPFSIKQVLFTSVKEFNVFPGEWFRPATAVLSIKNIFEMELKKINKHSLHPDTNQKSNNCTSILTDSINENSPKLNETKNISFDSESDSSEEQEYSNIPTNNNNKSTTNIDSEIAHGLERLEIIVCMDGVLDLKKIQPLFECEHCKDFGFKYIEKYKEEEEEEKSQCKCNTKSAFVIAFGMMGSSCINEIYVPFLKECIKLPQFCGMMGGKPGKALYFVGFKENDFIYLDPHYVQRACKKNEIMTNGEGLKTFEATNQIKWISYQKMDPAIGLGFYIKNKDDYDVFKTKLLNIKATCKEYSFISIINAKKFKQ